MPNTVSSFLNRFLGIGLENITADEVPVPRIKILQQLSPEIARDSDKYDPAAKAGHFYLTAPERSLGSVIDVIPLSMDKVWNEWMPNRGGFVGRHKPRSIRVDQSDFANWRSLETGNDINESWDWMVLLVDSEGGLSPGPVLFSMTSTKIKSAKEWMKELKLARTPDGKGTCPIFGCVWRLSTTRVENKRGSFYNISGSFENVRYITEEEFKDNVNESYKTALSIREAIFGDEQKAVSTPDRPALPEAESVFEDEELDPTDEDRIPF